MSPVKSLCCLFVLVTGCHAPSPATPIDVFPDMPPPTTFSHAYSLTENADGTIRVFAKESGDETWLYESRLASSGWTEPQRMDLPARRTLTGPSFSAEDGTLYYASDAELDSLPGRTDLNLWRVEPTHSGWSTPAPLEGDLNTGANETMAAISEDGMMVFVSNHSRLGGGGYDLGEARKDEAGKWRFVRGLAELNDFRTNDHVALTRDGRTLFFYSHREPKLGVSDIWYSHRNTDNEWQAPINPGAPVNSDTIDFGAGLSGDGQTFFLSRDGRLLSLPLETVLAGD